ncbi:diguanylate cyclase/phosphodiesterase [Alicyclobacillus sacchari]|uniref:Diguanylate cyclase/phosphodiesterase n=1 Tax=Alicyclobacillus sacchari TaxID=392010 RepID=A0A4R8LNR8_9BACL|nr:EAL domain-containing protein [Alicyclobacillus sacchari]TDY45290.1 diguanylate cyclase/phosphodiesterase [Alicyclobacillus sacchari]GMA56914.1 signaling protein YkoW [Alicyclobacillus sacchari]
MHIVPQHYHFRLVILSYIVASLASYAALDLGRRVVETRGSTQTWWMISGGAVMGIGIWSMHFIAMLALVLPVAMTYNWAIVALSLAFAMLGPIIALFVVARLHRLRFKFGFGAIFMGAGIVGMHYTGMAAMRLTGSFSYRPALFALSCVIAVGASFVALTLAFAFARADGWRAYAIKVICALVMGVAVAGMHYTGMWATIFRVPQVMPHMNMSTHGPLAIVVGIFGVMVLLLAIATSVLDRRLEADRIRIQSADERFRSLYMHHSDAIFTFDTKGNCLDMNPQARRLIGALAASVDAQAMLSMIEEGDRTEVVGDYHRATKGETTHSEFSLHGPNEQTLVVSAIQIPILVDAEVTGVFVIARDVTRERAVADQINHMAFHDALTQLPNRRLFEVQVDRFIATADGNAEMHILFVDLDRFKSVNDTLGHEFGDKLLQHVAWLIQEIVGNPGFVARMGGDEFTITLFNQPLQAAVAIADALIERLHRPLLIDDRSIYMTASLGLASYPQHGCTRDMLLRHADLAMYAAKSSGRGTYHVFEEATAATAMARLELEQELREAAENGLFQLVYQPKVSVSSGETVGVEALIRWTRRSGEQVSPAEFIPIAEETGLIVPIGEWCLRTAARQAKGWLEAGTPRKIAVNLSPHQVMNERFLGIISGILEETDLPPQYLEVEITESAMMDAEIANRFLSGCRALGIEVSLDDFGTGYSSLSRLTKLPLNLVKIDRSFTQHVSTQEKARALVRSIIDIAHNLGMRCLAEGVETQEQLAVIQSLGCDEAQGFLFSHPVPPDALGQIPAPSINL